jgi:hypothetical protein
MPRIRRIASPPCSPSRALGASRRGVPSGGPGRRPAGRARLTGALLAALVLAFPPRAAAIPATPLMTVYRFNGPLELPYDDVDRFASGGGGTPAGTLAQGTAVIPCLVVRDGTALTDRSGTPWVGFEVVVDARAATRDSTARFAEVSRLRKTLEVEDHRCPADVRHAIDVRNLVAMHKPPRFDPPFSSAAVRKPERRDVDAAVRAFHGSSHCEAANRSLVGRRGALGRAWEAFVAENRAAWPSGILEAAGHLDYVMRTAIYEGHLDRGCSAYGACERSVIALSIRNRARERCQRGQGCAFSGDFRGVASAVSQYNIWDELLTQVSGLTSCFLRPDLAGSSPYAGLQARYEQSRPDVERLLFGSEADLAGVFPENSLSDVKRLRHYYHPPAMGPCFPNHERLEYISGAVATKGDRFALIANRRIHVGDRRGDGFLFQMAVIDQEPDRDVVSFTDDFPGFVIDGRKVELRRPSNCVPYGTPSGCAFEKIGRYRKTPSWLSTGFPLRLTCRVESRGESCDARPSIEKAHVGGVCDKAMQPTAGVP